MSVYTYDHPYYDDDDDVPEAQEWQAGECDNCSGGDANGVTATGQGATEEECVCG